MRIASLVLGILGGLFGLGGSIFALFVGGIGNALKAQGAQTVTGLGLAAIPLAIIGIIGGALSLSKPKAASWLMLISAVGGTIAISGAYIIAGLMLLVGAIFAFIEARKETKTA